jgi:adenosine deaminase
MSLSNHNRQVRTCGWPCRIATNQGTASPPASGLAKGGPYKICAAFLAVALALAPLHSASAQAKHAQAKQARAVAPADRAARALEAVRGNPLTLRAFLVRMPKGADLHVHLSGAVYAESWIRAGAEDNLCVDLATLGFTKIDAMTRSVPPQPVCGEGKVPAAQALRDQSLYDKLINSFSMRAFVPYAGVSGHDHFFDTFNKFGGTSKHHVGEWLDEVTTRAVAQNEQYLELMVTPDFGHTAAIAQQVEWTESFSKLRDALLARGLHEDVAGASAHFDEAQGLRRERQHCGQAAPFPACGVQIRYLYQVLRGFPKEQVFAQALLGFEVASADPRVVGVNFVMPEDGYISMHDYALQMRMVGYLHSVYPKVHISLHAGEIAPGLVPWEGLCCHIRLAVEKAGAERIGHGVDVMYEESPGELLKEMAEKHVMVEINLSSNDLILGVSGESHPFSFYRKAHVPVALSTDDEGVSRIDLTTEYVRAVQTYKLSYADLKQMVRTGLEHSFLSGASLWSKPDDFSKPANACAKDTLGAEKPSKPCGGFLKDSERAKQQWELERRFRAFEDSF